MAETQKSEKPQEAKIVLVAPPLPATAQDLLALRKSKTKMTLIDHIDQYFVQTWDDNKELRKYLSATDDSQAIEGTLDDDNSVAANIIRNDAKKSGNIAIAGAKLHKIRIAMGYALKRFNQRRDQRAALAVPATNGNGDGRLLETLATPVPGEPEGK